MDNKRKMVRAEIYDNTAMASSVSKLSSEPSIGTTKVSAKPIVPQKLWLYKWKWQ